MSRDDDLQRVLAGGLVAILRAPASEGLVEVAEALLAGGVDVLEVTFTVPRAASVLEQVATRLGSRVLLGAGTVLDAETARTAIAAGAQFLVSPTLNLDVIRTARRYGKLVMPGAFTPTEILTAWEAGADLVKIFPSEITGPAYLKAIRAPLPQVRLLPTGGVNLQTAPDFLRAGASALGVGSSLVEPPAVKARDFARLTALAQQYVTVIRETRAALARQG